jgi:Ca2+-transporting ATPase
MLDDFSGLLRVPAAAAPGGLNAARVTMRHAAVPGRLRAHVAGLRHNARLAQHLNETLRARVDVVSIEVNALTGTVLLHYRSTTAAKLLAGIEAALDSPDAAAMRRTHAAAAPRPDPVAPAPRPGRTASAARWHVAPLEQLLRDFETSLEHGLTSATAATRLARSGPNAFPAPPRRSEAAMFFGQFKSLPVALLGASAVVSAATGGLVDAAVIVGVLVVNATIGFVTERQAERTIAALDRYTPRRVHARREGRVFEVPVEHIVTGDVLELAPGSYIAADARLLDTERLTVDESALTGESVPIAKNFRFAGTDDTPLAERLNLVHRGTLVTGGSGRALVVATGVDTEIGRIQSLVGETRPPDTPMQIQLDRMGNQLVLLGGAVCAGVFGLGLLRGLGLLPMLKTAISLAVAAVPEGLPTVATTTLALGIRDMRARKVLIRHLDAVETLGSVQVLCLDKTGTLTLNRMQLVCVQIDGHRYRRSERSYVLHDTTIDVSREPVFQLLLRVVALCNEADVSHSAGQVSFTGSATESALLDAALCGGLDVTVLRRDYPLQRMRHRTETTPWMATLHRRADGGWLVAVKGSPEQVLALCHDRFEPGAPLTDSTRSNILFDNERMAGEALRVLGVAYALIDSPEQFETAPLCWLGLVGLADPVRPGMDKLMRAFHGAGIETVMITGDQSATAYAIGKQLNLANGGHLEILDSAALDKVEPELLAGLVRKTHVFARVSPAHKLQIVQALQRAGKVVAMTGDGINDGPALKAANIGVAMGGGGTDVARSVADVVVEDDNLHTMVTAVEQGRTIYANIRKALRFLLSTNLSEVEVMVAAVAFGAGAPLTPMQLLWINLISDIFPGLALAMEPPETDVLKQPPRDPDEPIIAPRDFRRLALESGAISVGALASLGYALWRYGAGPRANTHVFMSLTIAQLLHALSCRSEKTTIFESGIRPGNRHLNLALGASLAAQAGVMTIPALRKLFNLAPVGPVDLAVIGASAVLPLLFNELTKVGRRTITPVAPAEGGPGHA